MRSTELYWPNGKRKRSIRFHRDLRSGLDEMWSEEGILIDSGMYEKGKPVGVHKRWNEKGLLIEEITYLDGKQTDFRAWDEEGNLWAEEKIVRKSFPIEEAVIPEGKGKTSDLSERYPLLSLIHRSWTIHQAPLESLTPFDVGHADAIYVYGLGGGAPYFQLKRWLQEKQTRKLIFLEENEGHFAHFLSLSHSHYLIEDTQVYLELERGGLAEKFPMQRIEIVAIPSRQGVEFQKFKLELLRKSTLSFALLQDRLHGYQPFKNFCQNLRHLPNSFYVNQLEGAFKGMAAIVCGAGPSLQEAIPFLKKLSNHALIIAGGSTLAALSSQGVPIHFGVAIDPNLEEYRRFKNSFAFDVPLIYSTRVHPSIFQTCNGPFGYMRSGIGGAAELWMEEEIGLNGPLIGEALSIESIAVTPIATALAAFFGCTTILFSGVDLAYIKGKHYASGVVQEDTVSISSLDADKIAEGRILRRKNYAGKQIHTATRWLMEAQSLADFAKKHKEIAFFNTSSEGLRIKGIPYMSFHSLKFERAYDFPSMIQKKIVKMPKKSDQMIDKKMTELASSLARVIEYLEVLSGKKKGSSPLAELDLQEEIACDLLFYDVNEILEPTSKWEQFLQLAKKYQTSILDWKGMKSLEKFSFSCDNHPTYYEKI